MCVTLLGRPYEKIRKGEVSIRDSLKKKNVSQRGLGSHRPPWYQSRVKLFKFNVQHFQSISVTNTKICMHYFCKYASF